MFGKIDHHLWSMWFWCLPGLKTANPVERKLWFFQYICQWWVLWTCCKGPIIYAEDVLLSGADCKLYCTGNESICGSLVYLEYNWSASSPVFDTWPVVKKFILFLCIWIWMRGQDSLVGVLTRYGLEGLGFEPWWQHKIFSIPFQTGSWAHPASLQWVLGLILGGKGPGVWHSSSTPI
jgi:hypothetical protein